MATDVVYLAVEPPLGAVDVAPTTELFVSAYAPSGIDVSTVLVTIDGATAVSYAGGGLVFSRPAYSGSVTIPSAPFLSLRIRPRRPFLYNVKPAITVTLRSLGAPLDAATVVFNMTTRGSAGTLVDVSLRNSRVETPLTQTPALEVYRVALLDALRGSSATPGVVALVYRVASSSLRGLLQATPFAAPARAELPRLRADDVGSWEAGAAAIDRLAPLWEAALRELPRLGIDAGTLRLVFAAGASPNAPERVAAACAAVLLAAQKQIDIERGDLRVPPPPPLP